MLGVYSVGTGLTLFHTLYGIQKSLGVLFRTRPRVQSWRQIAVGSLLISSVIVFSIAGFFEEIPTLRFQQFDRLYSLLLEKLPF